MGNPYTALKRKYEQLLHAALAVQSAVDDVAQLLERLHATVSWDDPHATMIFVLFCFVAAVVVAIVPWPIIQSFGLCFVVSSPAGDGHGHMVLPPVGLTFFLAEHQHGMS